MKFKLYESFDEKEMYEGWAQEDIDLFESIDWDEQGEEDYDAGCAYLESAVLTDSGGVQRVQTEFHKFFKNDPFELPYYKSVETRPFENIDQDIEPVSRGVIHKEYPVYNQYIIN